MRPMSWQRSSACWRAARWRASSIAIDRRCDARVWRRAAGPLTGSCAAVASRRRDAVAAPRARACARTGVQRVGVVWRRRASHFVATGDRRAHQRRKCARCATAPPLNCVADRSTSSGARRCTPRPRRARWCAGVARRALATQRAPAPQAVVRVLLAEGADAMLRDACGDTASSLIVSRTRLDRSSR